MYCLMSRFYEHPFQWCFFSLCSLEDFQWPSISFSRRWDIPTFQHCFTDLEKRINSPTFAEVRSVTKWYHQPSTETVLKNCFFFQPIPKNSTISFVGVDTNCSPLERGSAFYPVWILRSRPGTPSPLCEKTLGFLSWRRTGGLAWLH